MNLTEVALSSPRAAAVNAAEPIVHVCIVQASSSSTALGKEFVATDNGAPFATEVAALDAINHGIRRPDGALGSPWRQLRGHECEFQHPKSHVVGSVPVADLYAL